MNSSVDQESSWWGTFNFDVGQTTGWRIGALSLVLHRSSTEWHISSSYAESLGEDTEGWEMIPAAAPSADQDEIQRYVFRKTASSVRLTPILSDRSIVARPVMPFYVPPGEQTTIYVSAPLWVRIETGEPAVQLAEVPMYRHSDTWFGSSSLAGELCYATKTHARSRIEDVLVRPYRAISPVSIRNDGTDPMRLERICLPAPALSIFAAADGLLWTPLVQLIREQDGDMAAVKIENTAPQHARQARQIAEPRQPPDKLTVMRVLSSLFD